MKFSAAFAAGLAATVTAAPVNEARDIKAFTGLAIHSGSDVHLAPFEARDGAIWLFGKTKSYCPKISGVDCPKGDTLSFTRNKKGSFFSLNVIVPGGQDLYIRKDGRLVYNQAHDHAVPDNALQTGWKYDAFGNDGEADVSHKYGITACPTEGSAFAIYVKRPGWDKQKGCIGINMLAYETNKVGAWQYE